MVDKIKRFIVKLLMGEFALTAIDYYSEVWQANQSLGNDIKDLIRENKLIKAQLGDEKKIKDELAELKKHPLVNILGSIDMSQIKDHLDDMENVERANYVAQVFGVRHILEKEVTFLLNQHIEWWARNSLGGVFRNEAEQNAFARGNVNFADFVIQRFNILSQEHADAIQDRKEEQEDKNNPKPPLSSGAPMEMINLVNKVKIM